MIETFKNMLFYVYKISTENDKIFHFDHFDNSNVKLKLKYISVNYNFIQHQSNLTCYLISMTSAPTRTSQTQL